MPVSNKMKARNYADTMHEQASEVEKEWDNIASAVGRAMSGMLLGANKFQTELSQIIGEIVREMSGLSAADPMGQSGGGLINNLFGSASGVISGGGAIGNLFGGFADGGPIDIGKTILVGERGPELITPNQSGAVIPNNQINNAGGGVTVHMNISTPDARSFSQSHAQILAQLTQAMSWAQRNQ